MILAERLKQYVGQPIACLCARYWYRGILKEIGEDHIVMINPRAIEVTGPANATTPEREDIIPGDLMIRIDFMEIVCQPSWVYHEMSEKAQEKAKKAAEAVKPPRKSGR
jgi:hypothetical protein